jgi:hypothetical protein
MATQLRYLSSCTNTKKLVIEIARGGDIAGIDWPTQETIRIIAPVLKDLISQFDSDSFYRNQPALSSGSHSISTCLNKAQRQNCQIIGDKLIMPRHYSPVAFSIKSSSSL